MRRSRLRDPQTARSRFPWNKSGIPSSYIPYADPLGRSSVCSSHASQERRLHGGRGSRAGAGDRSEHGDFYGGESGIAGSAALPATGSHHEAGAEVLERRRLLQFHTEVHGVAAESGVRSHDALRFRLAGHEFGLEQPAGSDQGGARFGGLLQGVRRIARDRPRLHGYGGSAQGAAGGGNQLRLVAVAIRRRPQRRRAHGSAQRLAVPGGGRAAPRIPIPARGGRAAPHAGRSGKHQPGTLSERGRPPEAGCHAGRGAGAGDGGGGTVSQRLSEVDGWQRRRRRGSDARRHGGRRADGAAGAERSGRAGAVDCLRQRRQPVAGARLRAATRTGDPRGSGSNPWARGAPDADRKHGVGSIGRHPGIRAGSLGRARTTDAGAREPSAANRCSREPREHSFARLEGRRIHDGHGLAHRVAVRDISRAAGLPSRPVDASEGIQRALRNRTEAQSSAVASSSKRSGVGLGAAGGRGAIDPHLCRTAEREVGHRAAQRPDAPDFSRGRQLHDYRESRYLQYSGGAAPRSDPRRGGGGNLHCAADRGRRRSAVRDRGQASHQGRLQRRRAMAQRFAALLSSLQNSAAARAGVQRDRHRQLQPGGDHQ